MTAAPGNVAESLVSFAPATPMVTTAAPEKSAGSSTGIRGSSNDSWYL